MYKCDFRFYVRNIFKLQCCKMKKFLDKSVHEWWMNQGEKQFFELFTERKKKRKKRNLILNRKSFSIMVSTVNKFPFRVIYIDARNKRSGEDNFANSSHGQTSFNQKSSNSSYLISKIPSRNTKFCGRLIKTDCCGQREMVVRGPFCPLLFGREFL